MNKLFAGAGSAHTGTGETHTNPAWSFIFAAWLSATGSTMGALFLGEVMGFSPCVLCWYQRIFMFPLVFILAVGLFPLDLKVVRYALPLALTGWAIALYHLLLTKAYIPESASPCVQGVPCSQVQVEWFGFVTIPLLSLAAFSVIVVLLISSYFTSRK